jgi:hypothetical protein
MLEVNSEGSESTFTPTTLNIHHDKFCDSEDTNKVSRHHSSKMLPRNLKLPSVRDAPNNAMQIKPDLEYKDMDKLMYNK